MTQAEKKWLDWDENNYRSNWTNEVTISYKSREAYKEALRSAIEKQIKYHEDTGPMAQESRSTEIGMLKRFLKDMELVTPKE